MIVTLCLIVLTTIQPVSLIACAKPSDGSDCLQTEQRSLVCSGCGCCEVQTTRESCCCCSKRGVDETADRSTAVDAVEAFDAVGVACACGVSVPPMHHNQQRDQSVREQLIRLQVVETVSSDRLRGAVFVDRSWGETVKNRSGDCQRFLCVWRI